MPNAPAMTGRRRVRRRGANVFVLHLESSSALPRPRTVSHPAPVASVATTRVTLASAETLMSTRRTPRSGCSTTRTSPPQHQCGSADIALSFRNLATLRYPLPSSGCVQAARPPGSRLAPASAAARSARGPPGRLPGYEAECFRMLAAVVLRQDLGEGTRPVGDSALADPAAGDRQPGDGHGKAAGR